MAEVIHRYVGRGEQFVPAPPRPESKAEQERAQLDAEWRRKRISAEAARQRLHEAKLATMRGELIARKHVTKQASFLVLSLRARLLAIPATLAPKIVKACGGDQRAIERLIDDEVRDTLSELSDMPLKVSDPRWIETLDGESDAPPRP